MTINFVSLLFEIKYQIFGLLFFFTTLSIFWNKIFIFFNLRSYHNVQRVHLNEIPRLGGFGIYIFLWMIFFFKFIDNKLLFNLLISALPIVFIGLKEDLFHNTLPYSRIFLMILSCLLFFYINPILFPKIDIPFIGDLLSIYPISIIFFSFTIIVLMNGMNFIDGMNGLLGFTVLFQLITLFYLSFIYNDFEIMNLSIALLIPLSIFIIFNFPKGKIFAGDLGAYFFGFFVAIIVIIFYGRNFEILSWSAILLLFYPCFELLFSFIRKFKDNISPFQADTKHLHSLIYKKLIKTLVNKNSSNSLTTLTLSIFYATPAALTLFFDKLSLILISLSVLLCVYLIFYYLFKD